VLLVGLSGATQIVK